MNRSLWTSTVTSSTPAAAATTRGPQDSLHCHFESIGPNGRDIVENGHVQLSPDTPADDAAIQAERTAEADAE